MAIDPYAYARGRVATKIRQWKTGVVTLTRLTEEARDPDEPWVPVEKTEVVYTLDARVDGESAYVPGESINAGEEKLIVSPKARTSTGAVVDIYPSTEDKITIDGAVKVIKSVEAVPKAGIPARFNITVGI